MGDYEATGDELQKLVLMGKKRPMPFAFCPSSGGDDESLFATHRKKQPAIIAKAARKAANQNKVCYGTFTVEARLMTLVLIKELPSIAPRLKKHLRHERLSLNIKVVDVLGNELEADIEDMPEDALPDMDDAGGDEAEDDAAETAEDIAEAETDAENDLPDPKLLALRLKGLQPGIMALQGDTGDKLRMAMGGAVALLKAGRLVRAESTINAIDRLFARQAATPEPPAENPEAARKWAELAPKLEPLILATIKAGTGDVDALKRRFHNMQEQAAAGKHEAALAAAAQLARLIRASQTAQ